MKLMLLGASGLVGSRTLQLALSNDRFSQVIAPTRTPLEPHDRLVNPVLPRLADFVPALGSYQPNAVLCALGTTRKKAGSKEVFRHVDRDLPVAFGKAAHAAGCETCALVTAMGASENSMIFYSRTKGEVERDIRAIGFRSLTICRPSLIGGERLETRHGEAAALTLVRLLAPILPKRLRVNPADRIAMALIDAIIEAKSGMRLIDSRELV